MSDTPERKCEPDIIDAEVVPAEPGLEPSKPPVGMVVKRKVKKFRTFSPVVYQDGKESRHIQLSERELKLIKMYAKYGVLKKAAEEVGISYGSAMVYLKRPHVIAYITKLRERAAKAADLSIEKVAAVLSDAIDGKDVTAIQIQAATAATKVLNPSGPPGVHTPQVNTQNNYFIGGVGQSPFAAMDAQAMMEELKRGMLEMGDGSGD